MLRKMLRAALIGAATVFASKLPGQHWSTPPTATVQPAEDAEAAGAGDDEP